MPIKKIRNPIARMPLLHKGGVHVKSKADQRSLAKKSINKAVEEWKNGSKINYEKYCSSR